MKRIKHLQLVGKESRRNRFIRIIKEKDRTTEMKEGRTIDMKEDRITRMTEDLITDSKGDQTEIDKTKNPIPKRSNAMVVKDMVI